MRKNVDITAFVSLFQPRKVILAKKFNFTVAFQFKRDILIIVIKKYAIISRNTKINYRNNGGITMKFAKLGFVLLGSLVLGTATVAVSTTVPTPATTVSAQTVGKATINSTKALSKQGYTFRLYSGAGPLYKINKHGNFVKSVKSSVVNKLVAKHVSFKITKVFNYRGNTGSMMYYVVSKNGKYQGWVAAPNVYSSLTKSASLKALVKVETRITNRVANTFTLTAKQKKQNASDLKLAKELAAKVKGSHHSLAVTSVKQLTKFVKTGSSSDLPSIMWSVYYGA